MRTARITLILSFALLVANLLAGGRAAAEDSAVAPVVSVDLPAGTPVLPDPGPGEVRGVIINAANVQQFRSLIIPELYSYLRTGILEIDAVKGLQYPLAGLAAKTSSAIEPTLDLDGDTVTLRSDAQFGRVLPFGDATEIRKHSDAERQARMVLWNSAAVWWSRRVIDWEFALTWWTAGGNTRRVGGRLLRVYPLAAGESDKFVQLFREKVSFNIPSARDPLTWLTFRFFGDEEDVLWIYSPAIKRSRQLSGSNRGDPLLRTPVALDDLLTWSGKHELVGATISKSSVVLVPFAALDPANARAGADGCLNHYVSRPSGNKPLLPGSGRWNYETKRVPTAAPWVPTSAVWVPRPVWRIELMTTDPYALTGRQILYIDSELMIPYYRIVYDRSGGLAKFMFSAYTISTSAENGEQGIAPVFTIIDDRAAQRGYILETARFSTCAAVPPVLQIASFDPRKLGAASNSGKSSEKSAERADEKSGNTAGTKNAEKKDTEPKNNNLKSPDTTNRENSAETVAD